ncbi:hypothetical protein LCGC14_2215850 [marine sediment metagenome]|uniref:Uncharacterized protein n=1 Tax=marine sediment metagenome TaxID=412755 RepID=A0A0F9DZW4_9ZZZZ
MSELSARMNYALSKADYGRPVSDWAEEVAALEIINEELLEACKAIAALADGQGRANMLEVAGQAKQAIAKAEGR